MAHELADLARQLTHDGMTYVQVATRFNRDGKMWNETARVWDRASVQALIRHDDPDHRAASTTPERSAQLAVIASAPVAHAKPYELARVLYWSLLVLGVLSLIGGIIIGVQISNSAGNLLSDGERDQGLLWTWITIGVVQLVLYWSIAAALDLLRDIARKIGATR